MNQPQTKKCPHCAEDILAEAVKCKHCGSTLPTRRSWGQTIWTVVGVIFVIGLLMHFGDNPDDTTTGSTMTTGSENAPATDVSANASASAPAPQPVRRSVYKTTAPQLYAEFTANEVAADKRIGNAIVDLTAVVTSIQKSDVSGQPELQLAADTEGAIVMADLKTSDLDKAAALKIGDRIELRCDKVSMPFLVLADDCALVGKPRHGTLANLQELVQDEEHAVTSEGASQPDSQ